MLRNARPVGVLAFPGKKRYEGVRFNDICVTSGWVSVKFHVKICLHKYPVPNTWMAPYTHPNPNRDPQFLTNYFGYDSREKKLNFFNYANFIFNDNK